MALFRNCLSSYGIFHVLFSPIDYSSVIKPKGGSQKGGNKKTNKASQIFQKTNISYPLIRTRMPYYRRVVLWRKVESRTMMLLHDFLVALSTYGTSIMCARSITVSGISTSDFLQIPIIFSKTLSLVSFFSVEIPSNLRHSLLPYCSSSLISCCFYNFVF